MNIKYVAVYIFLMYSLCFFAMEIVPFSGEQMKSTQEKPKEQSCCYKCLCFSLCCGTYNDDEYTTIGPVVESKKVSYMSLVWGGTPVSMIAMPKNGAKQ